MPLQKITLEEIIKSSIRVFRKKGYYRTSISDLAKETGLTKGVFYHHFANKEEIMKTALKSLCSYFEARIFSIAYNRELPPAERLKEMTNFYLNAITKEPGGCFFANTILETAQNEDTFMEDVQVFFKNWEKAMIEIFSTKYSNDESTAIAEQIIADIEGSLMLMQLHKDRSYLERALERGSKRL